MVLERAEFLVREGLEEQLLTVLREQALPLAASYTGCRSFKALRCVEHPGTIMFLAEWDSIEAHHASREEPAHVRFRELLMPFAAGARETVHFTEV